MFKTIASWAMVSLYLQAVNLQPCDKTTFTNVTIKASKYSRHFTLTETPRDDIKLENAFTGCLTPTDHLKDAIQIEIINQKVPILFEGAVKNLILLEFLRLEQNSIAELKPDAFQNLPAIDVITVRSNQLEEIPKGVFNNLNVRALHLSNNSISFIDSAAFDNMPKLTIIYLERNNLKEWNGNWFFNSPNVIYLSVNRNQIIALPEYALKNFKAVSRVDFYHNKIEQIHVAAFKGLKQLECLDLERNNINSFSERVFEDLTRIQSLMLSYNKIRCVSNNFLNTLNSSAIFRISSNPLKCKCFDKIYNWAVEQKVKTRISNNNCIRSK